MGLFQDLHRKLSRRTIARTSSRFGPVRIFDETREGDRIRVLAVDGSYQSATYLDERWNEAPFEYLRRFFVVFDLGLPMDRLCMLGGGGYAFPKQLIAHHPGVRLDVVETDPAITRLARKYFFLDRLIQTYHTEQAGTLGLVEDDALTHLERCQEREVRYNAIINDCFAAEIAAQEFLSPRVVRLVRQCLTQRGIYLVNVIASYDSGPSEELVRLVDALSCEFGHIYALPCAHEREDEPYNMVVVAAREQLPLQGALLLFDEAD